jgi:hypothetical protein
LIAQTDDDQLGAEITRYLWGVKLRSWFILPVLWVQVSLVSPDLLKLPLLFAHYLEHQAASEELDLTAFVALHYTDHEHQEEDHGDHENLPFHHHHGAALDQHVSKVLANDPLRPVSFPALSALSAIALLLDQDLLAGHHPELLRPPRTQA